MKLQTLLANQRAQIIDEAVSILSQARLANYDKESIAERRLQLTTLYDLTVTAIEQWDLAFLLNYVKKIAAERFQQGFNLPEIQTAFNVLEEVIWRQICEHMPSSDYPEALGIISTALGSAKDCLANSYVSLASQGKVTSLDLSKLFNISG